MSSRKTVYVVAITYAFLIVCNLAFALTIHGWHLYCLHLAALAGLFYIYKFAGLDSTAIGLESSRIIAGLKYSLIVIVPVGCILLAVFLLNGNYFLDPRYRGNLPAAFASAMILEPLKTILFEELVFRGILLALFLRITRKQWRAAIYSSLSFGLWHVLSSLDFASFHTTSSIASNRIGVIFGTVLFTTVASIVFCELRLRSKSLAAPIAAHWFVNSFAIILATLSWQKM